MRSWTVIATIASLVDLTAASGAVSLYNIDDPMFGTCRLKGTSASSDNFKFYASVSNKDFALNEACARCITVKRADDSTKTTSAYVLDVCDGCAPGTLRLSADAMTALDIKITDSTTKVSYAFDSCPTSLMSGDIKACLMEGGSATYVPLQFYNSQKVISRATIDGVPASTMPSSFLYSANPSSSSASWYESVDFSVTSEDGETLNGNFAFANTSGCATSDVQFYSASAASGSAGAKSSGAIVGAICGGFGALLIIVGLVALIWRRKREGKALNDPERDMENQYMSSTSKPKAVLAATYRSDHDDHLPLASPAADYAASFSPPARPKVPGSQICDADSLVSSPVATVARSIAVDYPGSVDHSSATSAPNPYVLSAERSPPPEPVNVAPTYAFSNNMTTSPHSLTTSNAKDAPMLAAPVVPRQSLRDGFYDDDTEEERSSFDIDDMRECEARATSTRHMDAQPSFAPSYVNTVTSPGSNVHTTSLRHSSSKQSLMRTSDHESGLYNNSSAISNRDSYAPTVPRQTNESTVSSGTGLQSGRSSYSPAPDDYSFSAPPSRSANTNFTTDSPIRDSEASFAAQQNTDLSASQHSWGSTRESGGYSRKSLNILGYPYSKASGRHNNLTG